jgi:uncharacterized surface protein with fasciclin (FAS1) repeats
MKRILLFLTILTIIVSSVFFAGCKKQQIEQFTTADVNIVGYLDKRPDSFSLFRQILERTGNAAYLNAYGSYTCFAPTNSGVRTYLTKINAASVDAADLNTLKDMVRLHLLEDTLYTSAFTDGKLPIVTMYGQFLITSVSNQGGVSRYIINRQALVIESNIRVGNGIIHVINNVLLPATRSIAKQLEEKPEYSIFVEALKATKLFDTLNYVNPDINKRWVTVFAESNQALADSGIHSYAELAHKYSSVDKTEPLDSVHFPNDSLHMYIAYHISAGLKFLGDIIGTPTHETWLPQEVVSIRLINQEVLVNEDIFNGILEHGVKLNRPKSDNAATNGVWHDAAAHFMVKFRKPTALFWDVSSFEEIMKLPAYYKRANYNFVRNTEADNPIKDSYWQWGPLASTNTLSYEYSTSSTISSLAYNNDVNTLPLGLPNRPVWWEMRTPPIVKGRYKVWICYRGRKQSSSSNMLCKVEVNGVLMQRTVNFTDNRPSGSDAELEAIGWKRYTADPASRSEFAGRQVGVIDFTTTQQQVLRITPLVGTQNFQHLDMIHFIPVDEDQVKPRFLPDGTKVY